jgi:hypothetical protein
MPPIPDRMMLKQRLRELELLVESGDVEQLAALMKSGAIELGRPTLAGAS